VRRQRCHAQIGHRSTAERPSRRPHDVNLAVRLTVVWMQCRLVPEAPARTRERDPRAVGRPGEVRVVAGRMCQSLKPPAIRLDRTNLVVAFQITGEGDEITRWRPGWKIVSRRTAPQLFRSACRPGAIHHNSILVMNADGARRSVLFIKVAVTFVSCGRAPDLRRATNSAGSVHRPGR
jgi:hypothetical protein